MKAVDCAKLLLSRDNFLILTHRNPDGDTLGSAGALCHALRRMGKTAWLFPNPDITDHFRPLVERYLAPGDFAGEYTLAVDIAAETQFPKGFEGKVDLGIDHHPSNSRYASRLLLQEQRASCGEIMLRVIKAMCGNVSKAEADLLYTAVSTDTGCFLYGNTDAECLRAAAELLEYGAENGKLNLYLFRKVSPARIRLEGLINSSLEFYRDGTIVVAIVTREMLQRAGATPDDCDDLANLPGRARGGILSVLIREGEDGSSRISLRSSPEVDCSRICAVFGGGGHAMAAGCTIQAPPTRARDILLEVVNEVWRA